jgi:phage terminase large subunit-like protein
MKNLDKVIEPYFGVKLFPYQKQIVESIFSDSRKVTIRACTRAGKSYTVALSCLLYALVKNNKKVGIIAPTQHKTKIVMGYIADFLSQSQELMDLLDMDISAKDVRRFKKEASKQRITFKNGCSIEVLTADLLKGGQALMGRAFDLTVCLSYGTKVNTDKGLIKIGKIVKIGKI